MPSSILEVSDDIKVGRKVSGRRTLPLQFGVWYAWRQWQQHRRALEKHGLAGELGFDEVCKLRCELLPQLGFLASTGDGQL